MKLQRILIIFAFLAVMVSVIRTEETARVYCGRHLASTLALLCENGMMVKRAEAYNSFGSRGGWPWLAPHHARSMGRGKRQVVSECCDKPCTIDELLTYCVD